MASSPIGAGAKFGKKADDDDDTTRHTPTRLQHLDMPTSAGFEPLESVLDPALTAAAAPGLDFGFDPVMADSPAAFSLGSSGLFADGAPPGTASYGSFEFGSGGHDVFGQAADDTRSSSGILSHSPLPRARSDRDREEYSRFAANKLAPLFELALPRMPIEPESTTAAAAMAITNDQQQQQPVDAISHPHPHPASASAHHGGSSVVGQTLGMEVFDASVPVHIDYDAAAACARYQAVQTIHARLHDTILDELPFMKYEPMAVREPPRFGKRLTRAQLATLDDADKEREQHLEILRRQDERARNSKAAKGSRDRIHLFLRDQRSKIIATVAEREFWKVQAIKLGAPPDMYARVDDKVKTTFDPTAEELDELDVTFRYVQQQKALVDRFSRIKGKTHAAERVLARAMSLRGQ